MNKKKINIFILIIAIILVLYFTLKDDFKNIIFHLSTVNKLIFLLAIFIFLCSLLFKALSLKIFLNEYKKDYSLFSSFKLTLITQFLNGITPFQTGGQPFEIYLLKKEGIAISSSTNAIIKDFISFQISLIAMGIFAVVANYNLEIIKNNNIVNILILLGFAINVIVLLLIILILKSKKVITSVITKLLNVVDKFKLVKKILNNKEKILQSLENFYKAGKEIRKNKLNFIKGILCNLISLFLLYLIPFIVFISLGQKEVSIVCSIISTAFVMLIGNFIPIPGATGGIEYSFIKLFGIYIKNPILSSGMLIWRFITYVLGMLIGFFVLLTKRNLINKKKGL